jgi:hypothetical protein
LRIAFAQVNALASSIYNPDLASSDFHKFPTLQEFLSDRRFKSKEEVKDAVKKLLDGLVVGGLRRRHAKTLNRLRLVPEYCW